MKNNYISIEDILVNIILKHTEQCITPIELNMVARELSVEDILTEDQCKSIAKRVVSASGYILSFRAPEKGEKFIDTISFINPDEGAHHVEPGTRPTKYFKNIVDPSDSNAQGLIFNMMKDYNMYQKGKNKDFVNNWKK